MRIIAEIVAIVTLCYVLIYLPAKDYQEELEEKQKIIDGLSGIERDK